jgi:hypothetical protein
MAVAVADPNPVPPALPIVNPFKVLNIFVFTADPATEVDEAVGQPPPPPPEAPLFPVADVQAAP